MRNRRTVRKNIREFFPEHCQRICEIIHANNSDFILDVTNHGGLVGWFRWDRTPEGHDYWLALHEGLLARRTT